MIITLVGADFSENNIGKLDTWLVQTSFGSGVTHTGASYVDLGAAYATTITIADDYELNGSVIVTMGGNAITEGIIINGNTITISIAAVTSNVMIKVPTKNIAGGEEEEPDTPINPTNYTFTINPDPTSANVTLSATGYSTVSGTGRTSITVANGTEVNWSINADGYTTRTGNWTINGSDKIENIVLSTSGGSTSALDLNTLTLAHCGSAKLGTGDKENLIYDQTTHELKVHSTGWYKVSYFEQPVTVGTEIEYVTNYGKTQTGNFVGIYTQEDLVDGVAEAKSSFWPAPSGFGVYAPGQGGNDFIYIWDKVTTKAKTVDNLEGDYFNGKTIKIKLLATGAEIYVDGEKLTWASGITPPALIAGTNYYLGFHNSASTSVPADTGVAQTITYIGPIR